MSTKKTPSLASPLDAQEVKYRTPKSRKKERSVHDKELAEIAWEVYFDIHPKDVCSWRHYHDGFKENWRSVVRAVVNEAIYRVEANIK